jgi:hypothetical protein
MKLLKSAVVGLFLLVLSVSVTAQTDDPQASAPPQAQPAATTPQEPPAYKPKFAGDPARSDAEAVALGYMRTVLRAQKEYKKKNDHYATSLLALVHTGSFTRRMANSERGDYTVGFRPEKDGFDLTLTPKELKPDRRSFFADEDGNIYADDQKAADEHSEKIVKISMK